MPRTVKPLTDKQVNNAKPREKAYTFPDGNGLQLLIAPDGRKSWELIYLSPKLHKRRKTSFGAYPYVTLADARAKRDEYHTLIKEGIDPIDDKREEKAEVKLQKESDFSNVVDLWFQSQESHIVHSTYKKKRALFDTTVIPVLKHKSIAEIKHDELVQIIKIKAIQTPETAKREKLIGDLKKEDIKFIATGHGECIAIMSKN